jgi:hypothetical protein
MLTMLRSCLRSIHSRRDPRVQRARIRLEPLEGRDVPSTYYWVGGSLGDNKWSTLDNWRLNSADPSSILNRPSILPGSGDTVKFDATAASDGLNDVRPDSVMDGSFTIGSLVIENRAAAPYQLTLNGTLGINGMSGEPTVLNAGDTGGLFGAGPVTFTHVETGEFDWQSGKIYTTVNVTAGTTFHIETDLTPTGGKKELGGQIWDYSGNSDWDGKGQFSFTGQDTAFTVLGTFNVTQTQAGNATIHLGTDARFENQGTVKTTFAVGSGLVFADDGRVTNFGTWQVAAGYVAAGKIQNSGVIQLDANGVFFLGRVTGWITTNGWVLLDPSFSPSSQSVITGPGLAGFESPVTVSGGTAEVENVQDNSGSLSGAGKLVITGTYTWDYSLDGSTNTWTGPGITQVGTDTNRTAKLVLKADTFSLNRQIVCYGTLDWTKVAPAGPVISSEVLVGVGGGIDIKAPLVPPVGPPQGGLFTIDGTGPIAQRIKQAGGAGGLRTLASSLRGLGRPSSYSSTPRSTSVTSKCCPAPIRGIRVRCSSETCTGSCRGKLKSRAAESW